MRACLLTVSLLVLCASAAQEQEHPVAKVITLLKDMVKTMEKEAEQDKEVFENMACWCETNEKEKTKAITEAEQRLTALTSAIEELTGEGARLDTEVKNLKKEIMKNTQALDQATALRNKQLAEFNQEEKDMLQSITSLKAAVVSLSKHNQGLLAKKQQVREREALEALKAVRGQLHSHKALLSEVVTPTQRRALEAFIQDPSALLQLGSAAPQSGEIFGILKAMQESFETNLAASQKDETENVKAYSDLKAAKEGEIKAAQDQVDTKSAELGSTSERNAQSKQDKEDTEQSLEADKGFLADVKSKCANSDAEYALRTKTRQMETAAVGKALEFLSSDDAHELFSRTFSASFLQQGASVHSVRKQRLVRLLQETARRSNDPRLSQLAVKMRMDAFFEVKEAMKKMIETLLKEKEDEFKHKDFCVEELNKNSRATMDSEREKAELEGTIGDLTAQIADLDQALTTLKAEVAELKKQLKYAGEDREKANKDFQITVADQKATQKLIGAALGVLKGFYEKSALVAAHAKVQAGQAPPPPPAGFKAYEKNKQSGGVMGMMEGIIAEAKEMEAEAIRAESSMQEEYEEFVKDTNVSLEEKMKDIANKSEVRAKAEAEKVEASTNLDEVETTLEQLAGEAHDLHVSCDFLLKNFEVRSVARDEEIEAMKQGISMFSGANFGALAQHYAGPM